MKTLVLFHRLELTDMFAPLSKELAGKINIVHLAYSEAERKLLKEYQVDGPVITFKDEIKKLWNSDLDIGQEVFDRIDDDIVKYTNGNFNLNGAIERDRGFSLLNYKECLRLTAVYYRFWNNFLESHNVDYVMHESTSLMMNFICGVLCIKRGASYIYQIMSAGDGKELCYLTLTNLDYRSPELEQHYKQYVSGEKQVDRERCDVFLKKYREVLDVYLGGYISITTSKTKLVLRSLRNRLRKRFCINKYDRIIDNIDYWEISGDTSGQRLRNLMQYPSKINFDDFDSGLPYYYYPLHLEPEAVVLYNGSGFYANQTKLIENIAAQLPPGIFLYVKDHPHDFGYRLANDYSALKNVHNIRLIRHDVPGKLLVKHSIGVLTITGTAGFEAILMGKQVYTFGNTYYKICPRVNYVHNVRELREVLYRNRSKIYVDDKELYFFVAAYLDTVKEGMVDYFLKRASKYQIDLNKNIVNIAEDFVQLTGII